MSEQQMAAVFNEWARRCAEAPETFTEILDQQGRPIPDYGLRAARTFAHIAAEMQARDAVPRATH